MNQIQELAKCKLDPIYFLENHIYIEEPGGVVQFKPYNAQKDLVKTILNDHYVIVLKSRQIGISTVIQAFSVYLVTFFKNITVGVISRDGPEATDFVRKTRLIYESLPKWMRHDFIKKTEQSFELSNNSRILAATVNQSNPQSVFRGKTITFLIIDEAAHVRKIEEAFIGMSPAVLRAHDVAKSKGIPYGIAIMSTPKGTTGVGEWFYKTWVDANSDKSLFTPVKIHYSQAPFTTDEWLEKQKQMLAYKEDAIEQELELKFITSDNSFFEKETFKKLQQIVEQRNEGITTKKQYVNQQGDLIGQGEWTIFEEPKENKSYLIGVDVAPLYGSCKSAIEVFDSNLNQVAEFNGKLRITDLQKEIKWIAKSYPQCLLIIESNSYATKLIEDLDDDEEISHLLFRTPIEKLKGSKRKVDYFPGVYTDSLTRPKMLQALYDIVSEYPYKIKSPKLAKELMALDKYGKSRRLSDRAMSFAFICYVYKYFPETIPETGLEVSLQQKQLLEDITQITSDINEDELKRTTRLKKSEKLSDREFEDFILFDKGNLDIDLQYLNMDKFIK